MDCVSHISNLLTFTIHHIIHIKLVKLWHDVNDMWWGNQELERQEWEDFIKSKKTRILDIIMLVPKK